MIPFITSIKSPKVTSIKGNPNILRMGRTITFRRPSTIPPAAYNCNPPVATTHVPVRLSYGRKYAIPKRMSAFARTDIRIFITQKIKE